MLWETLISRQLQERLVNIRWKIQKCTRYLPHPELKIDKLVVTRSFYYTLEQLTDLSYLNDDMLENRDPITKKQLRDCAIYVSNKKAKFSLFEMFSTELKIARDRIKGWFHQKYKRRFLELDTFSKQKYEKVNVINWDSDKCVICNFLLALLLINGVNVVETRLGSKYASDTA